MDEKPAGGGLDVDLANAVALEARERAPVLCSWWVFPDVWRAESEAGRIPRYPLLRCEGAALDGPGPFEAIRIKVVFCPSGAPEDQAIFTMAVEPGPERGAAWAKGFIADAFDRMVNGLRKKGRAFAQLVHAVNTVVIAAGGDIGTPDAAVAFRELVGAFERAYENDAAWRRDIDMNLKMIVWQIASYIVACGADAAELTNPVETVRDALRHVIRGDSDVVN